MKQYALFEGDNYYPGGGWDDFKGFFDTLDEAVKNVAERETGPDWFHIVNLNTLEIFARPNLGGAFEKYREAYLKKKWDEEEKQND